MLIFNPLNGYCLEVNQKLSLFSGPVFNFQPYKGEKAKKLSSKVVTHMAMH